jgi:hypothetical protein
MLDSGASQTCIPTSHLREIGARRVDFVQAVDFSGVRRLVGVYEVGLEILGMTFPCFRVLGIEGSYGLVGRDLLTHFCATLDGPQKALLVAESAR